jgi:hypothetical protein
MDILITADNPKGLAYEYLAGSVEKTEEIVKTIHRQGGENIAINGFIIPPSTLEVVLAK